MLRSSIFLGCLTSKSARRIQIHVYNRKPFGFTSCPGGGAKISALNCSEIKRTQNEVFDILTARSLRQSFGRLT